MEVVVKMEGTKPTGSSSETSGDAETLMLGRFTMVCRDSKTQKARKVPRLIVETAEESTLWEIGEGMPFAHYRMLILIMAAHKKRRMETSMLALDKVPVR